MLAALSTYALRRGACGTVVWTAWQCGVACAWSCEACACEWRCYGARLVGGKEALLVAAADMGQLQQFSRDAV